MQSLRLRLWFNLLPEHFLFAWAIWARLYRCLYTIFGSHLYLTKFDERSGIVDMIVMERVFNVIFGSEYMHNYSKMVNYIVCLFQFFCMYIYIQYIYIFTIWEFCESQIMNNCKLKLMLKYRNAFSKCLIFQILYVEQLI